VDDDGDGNFDRIAEAGIYRSTVIYDTNGNVAGLMHSTEIWGRCVQGIRGGLLIALRVTVRVTDHIRRP
jgi:hypothetical protein